jgi:DNA gyrase subunit A
MADSKDNDPLPATNTPLFAASEKIQKINVADEIKNSFLDYSMSVIISRALPDARDGLKPSQRRILLAMHDLNLSPGRHYRKCAKICGDTSGNYHPHGEATIYPTLVNMAQPWSMRGTLVDGQGNFGSVEGDPPAAMRYTEARLTHLGHALMIDMDKDTVDWTPNYDETREEPTVFPAAFPNLLINGGTGIAVGMATSIPPHNLGEIVDGICAQIDDPDITIEGLMQHIKGPDFPTGCLAVGLDPIRDYFKTGRGSIKQRGRVGVEQLKGNREQMSSRRFRTWSTAPRWSRRSRGWPTTRRSPTSPPCATSRTRTRAWSSSSSATPCPRWSSTSSSSSRNWPRRSA